MNPEDTARELLEEQEQAARDKVTTIIVVKFGEITPMYAMGKILDTLYRMNGESWDLSSWDASTITEIVCQHRY
jgi:hypothetical protein